MVRNKIIIGVICGLVISMAGFAQKTTESTVRIVCHSMEHVKLVKMVRPTYPESAKRAHIEGVVLLTCLIGTDGSVKQLDVVRGQELLVQAALEAVSQWKYEPLKLNGQAIQEETSVRVIFELPKKKKQADPN
jgi:TonB family protein